MCSNHFAQQVSRRYSEFVKLHRLLLASHPAECVTCMKFLQPNATALTLCTCTISLCHRSAACLVTPSSVHSLQMLFCPFPSNVIACCESDQETSTPLFFKKGAKICKHTSTSLPSFLPSKTARRFVAPLGRKRLHFVLIYLGVFTFRFCRFLSTTTPARCARARLMVFVRVTFSRSRLHLQTLLIEL